MSYGGDGYNNSSYGGYYNQSSNDEAAPFTRNNGNSDPYYGSHTVETSGASGYYESYPNSYGSTQYNGASFGTSANTTYAELGNQFGTLNVNSSQGPCYDTPSSDYPSPDYNNIYGYGYGYGHEPQTLASVATNERERYGRTLAPIVTSRTSKGETGEPATSKAPRGRKKTNSKGKPISYGNSDNVYNVGSIYGGAETSRPWRPSDAPNLALLQAQIRGTKQPLKCASESIPVRAEYFGYLEVSERYPENKKNPGPTRTRFQNAPMGYSYVKIMIGDHEYLHSNFIDRDGACLFRAFSFLYTGQQEYHEYFRQETVEGAVRNWTKIEGFIANVDGDDDHLNQTKWVKSMRESGEYADGAAISCLYRVFKVKVAIYSEKDTSWALFGRPSDAPYYAFWLSNEHYEVLSKL